MKTIFVRLLIFCITMVFVKCQTIDEELQNIYDMCLKEFDIEDDEVESTDVDLTCFTTCLVIKSEIIKDKKFNLEKNIKYIQALESEEDAEQIIEAYEYCVSEMPEIEDECTSIVQLEECVNEQIRVKSESESESEE